MDSHRWRQVERIYHAALECEPGGRSAFLATACHGDEELRSEVQSLLAQDGSREGLLDRPAWEGAASLLDAASTSRLAPGAELGPYRIEMLLGTGGMGEVYKARDTRLGRSVALKISAKEFSNRFEHEARMISALSHPNICTLYDVGPNYLVMEYVGGETLATRLRKGSLGLDAALRYGIQIADALAAAHTQGIVHRDLKPANIMLTKTGVKLLDFGLARTCDDPKLTESHMAMGTPAYMAPEQLEGKECLAQTDIYALGLVISEVASGTRGSLVGLPPHIAHIVRRCLEPDLDNRWQSAKDIKAELEWAHNEPPATAPRALPRWMWSVAAGLITVGLALGVWLSHVRQPAGVPEFSAKLSLNPPENTAFSQMAVSPDGRKVAFTAIDSAGKMLLWVRRLDTAAAQPVADTEGARSPFWSPDSRSIGFFAQGKLRKIESSGGSAQTLANAPIDRGGTWSKDGVIVFAPVYNGPLERISDAGGEPKTVTKIDPARGENSHRWPQFLPDGRHFLYVTAFSESEKQSVYVGSLDSNDKVRLGLSNASAVYAPGEHGGYLLFVRQGVLMAQPFDSGTLRITGEAFRLAEPVGIAAGWQARISVSNNGVLLYQSENRTLQQLTLFDRLGVRVKTIGPPLAYQGLALSPDEHQVAVRRGEWPNQGIDIWLIELATGTSSRFTFNRIPPPSSTVWSPAGDRIIFATNRYDGHNIFEKRTAGARSESLIIKTPTDTLPTSWSRTGKWLVFQQYDPKTHWDLWLLPLDGVRKPIPFQCTEFDEQHAQFSPDGKWIAFESNESGESEVYVRGFSKTSEAYGIPSVNAGRWQISAAGGMEPRWRADGKELFYLAPGGKLTAVAVDTAHGFEAEKPRWLFSTALIAPAEPGTVSRYAVMAKGQRFLIVDDAERKTAPPATVVLNWQSGLPH
jgi:Tol biopolymer transport system component/tRNA A-37 threonylcarbamoyl transferase component Bud32